MDKLRIACNVTGALFGIYFAVCGAAMIFAGEDYLLVAASFLIAIPVFLISTVGACFDMDFLSIVRRHHKFFE